MSRRNGTRSRADLQWKAKLQQRERIRELRKQLRPPVPNPAGQKTVKE
jgi:hypothetical protein